MRLAEATIDIAATPARTFELFTTEDGLCQWMARTASVDLRPGGAWRWVHEDGAACSGEYIDVEPPERLSFTYGWESGRFDDVPAGSTRVDVAFEPIEGGTRVTVRHAGLVGDRPERHTVGWTHFLGVLRTVAESQPRLDHEGSR